MPLLRRSGASESVRLMPVWDAYAGQWLDHWVCVRCESRARAAWQEHVDRRSGPVLTVEADGRTEDLRP